MISTLGNCQCIIAIAVELLESNYMHKKCKRGHCIYIIHSCHLNFLTRGNDLSFPLKTKC